MTDQSSHDETVEVPTIENICDGKFKEEFLKGLQAINKSYDNENIDKKSKRVLMLKLTITANDPEARSLSLNCSHSVKLPDPITRGGHLKRTKHGELFQLKETAPLFSEEKVSSINGE